MRHYLTEKTEHHDNGILGKLVIESNLNVCTLKNGHIAISLREGEKIIAHEMTVDSARHLIGLLSKLAAHD